jgi:hypothetical protein
MATAKTILSSERILNATYFSDRRNQGSESAQGPSLIRQQGQGMSF